MCAEIAVGQLTEVVFMIPGLPQRREIALFFWTVGGVEVESIVEQQLPDDLRHGAG